MAANCAKYEPRGEEDKRGRGEDEEAADEEVGN
jgi:hypothetical protein